MRLSKEKMLAATRKGLKAVSFILVLKGAVGFSVAVLAIVGVTVPILGIEPTPVVGGGAAIFGALLGAILALRA